jgi:acetyl-CoA synthetase
VPPLPLAQADAPAITARVLELRDRFADPTADVAALLCDGHAADAVAVTAVDASGHVTTLTYGQLQERSTRCARAFRSWASAAVTGSRR